MLYGKNDPQDAAVVAICIYCGGEIYAGDSAYIPAEYDGMVCPDCIKDWMYETYVDALCVRCEVRER